MGETRHLVLSCEAAAARLDRALADAWPDLSRSRVQALIREGCVELDALMVTDPSFKVHAGAAVRLAVPEPAPAAPSPEAITLDVVFEDDDLIVIDKPAGLVVHPGAGNERGTLVNALLHHCGATLSGIGGVSRPGIVHRLDKGTSGLLVAAKTERAHRGLSEQFADHGRTGPLERAYLAFAWGMPEPVRSRIETELARSSTAREKMAVVGTGRGRRAVTRYVVEEIYGRPTPVASLVRCTLETGRTHQIRVHLAHIRHPLLGDAVYGAGYRTKARLLSDDAARAVESLGRQALHATLLRFAHPATGAVMRFESGLPAELAELRRTLVDV